MRKLKWSLFGLLLASAAAHPLSGPAVASDNVKARLISEVNDIAPGQSVWVALEFNIRDGWHTYWRNPGDSGQATKLAWTLPAGVTAGEILWTAPHRFEVPPLINYGYAKHAMHLVQITAAPDLEAGAPLALAAKASWLVCADVCIPESAELQLHLPVTAHGGAIDPAAASLFAAARSELPSAAPAPTSAGIHDGQLAVTLGKEWGATLSQIKSLAFFPYDEGIIEYAAPQTLTRREDSIELAMKIGYQAPQAGPIRGVLLATEQSGNDTVAVPLEVTASYVPAGTTAISGPPRFAPGTAASGAAGSPDIGGTPALPVLVLLAILGGLILNLMPCVFPVLSIKAIGLVEQAKRHPAAVRMKGLVFAAGVISSMLSLAAVLLALRAGGEQIGWGFQLQSPLFVTLMIYLLLAVGLNLSGVFEVGGGLAGVGDGLTQGDSYRASFFTGVLTTLVATPCTAPFMAAAVGAALTQSSLIALVIFAALGAGLALPYLLLSLAPWMRRALPKPGAWMDTLKQIFAFPMYASAAWLLWVLAQQTSSIGLGAALAGAILVALAAWSYQKSKWSSSGGRVTALVTATAAVVLAIALPVRFANVAAASGNVASPAASPAADLWQPYDAARVAELNTRGQPLLLNFTASWCLTCLVNERNAFADAAVQRIFRGKGVTLMKGDWTNRDPAITKALSLFGRAGVPLYVVYNSKPGSTTPVVLPQLLTAGIVQSAFADLPNRDSK
jgi:thiol:disulfide interchange protein/DsbC/DsbD-like thiol-disulfide interchange protein